jgi:hypothetical protein
VRGKSGSYWSAHTVYNLALILKSSENQEQVLQLRLELPPKPFPFTFLFQNINEIQINGLYLLSLLIFGFPHQLIWECALVNQTLIAGQVNYILFDVHYVGK